MRSAGKSRARWYSSVVLADDITQAVLARKDVAKYLRGAHGQSELEARDDSGNVAHKSVKVFVPHDESGQTGCQKALVIDAFSTACEQ